MACGEPFQLLDALVLLESIQQRGNLARIALFRWARPSFSLSPRSSSCLGLGVWRSCGFRCSSTEEQTAREPTPLKPVVGATPAIRHARPTIFRNIDSTWYHQVANKTAGHLCKATFRAASVNGNSSQKVGLRLEPKWLRISLSAPIEQGVKNKSETKTQGFVQEHAAARALPHCA